jgi:hypothetical protein
VTGRLLATSAAVLAVSAALSGCSAGQGTDAWAGRGAPVANPGPEPAPTPPSQGIVTGISGLRVALEGRVIASAGLIRPVTSGCGTADIEPRFTCRVTYLGQTVTYRVTTTPDSSDGFPDGYTWKATPDTLIATRAGVEAAIWREYATRATAISCDTPFPAVQRAAPATALAQRCYFKPTPGDKASGANSGNADRTVVVQVKIYDGRIALQEITQ